MLWTEEQARALITDSGTLKRGLELAAPRHWSELGRTATAAWGHCAGSGSRPYQVALDLSGPAFKCSCPSRVFPCKHGAGLLLLLARQPELLPEAAVPAWLAEWLTQRQQTQEKKAAKEVEAAPAAPATTTHPPEPSGEVSPQRLERMQRGAAELLVWLQDLISTGLAQTEKQPLSYWENQAARLVDDQLPGLAGVLRELPALRYAGLDWPERLLARLGELHLLAGALQRLAQLPDGLRQDVLQLVGVNVKKDDVLSRQPTISDEWLVVGQATAEEDRLLVRRSWLWGQHTGRYALVLEYAFGGQPFATPLVPGGQYRGGLAFYPGSLPLRAVVGTIWTFTGLAPQRALPPGSNPAALLDDYATALGQLPWLREWPSTLTEVVPVPLPDGDTVLLHPPSGVQLPLRTPTGQAWDLLAASGGHPLTVFGEWNGRAFLPLTYSPVAFAAGSPL
ncbi:hypothetical protein [Hymenobacter sp. CRA2]|uniref:hypothetical protein n=1 Tax=Hymenobacter sp. CRA2 TaxID=1955620 RepID=UPI0009900B62|nr:hypothetical protein [Hymenobacter sp. CRA2]OON69471.1 hypothetical protein B0919_09355 [Hymenobacter sp. CRA2]